MAIVFFIEIYQVHPNFSTKIDRNDVISIYPSLNKEVAEENNGKHKDIGYSAKIDACIEFDCSGFVVGKNAAGKIDVCATCPAPQQPTPPSPPGTCASYAALNSYLNNLPARVTNSDPNTATAYATHLSNGTDCAENCDVNAAGARSGYWLGLTDCDSVATSYQCAVSCGSGSVAFCYPTSGAPKEFGSLQTFNGESYQIYDPVQLYAAGVSPTTGMSFTLKTTSPGWSAASAGTECNGPPSLNLSSTGGTSSSPGGSGGPGSSNCFSTNPNPPPNYNGGNLPPPEYVPKTPQEVFDSDNVIVTGIPPGCTSIGVGDQCFFIGGASSGGGGAGSLLLGGTPNGERRVVTLRSFGGVACGNCSDCANGRDVDNPTGNDPRTNISCQSLASSQISINGAPEYTSTGGDSGGPGWTSGGVIWDNYNYSEGDDGLNSDLFPSAFAETTCAMDDIFGQSHGQIGYGARAIVPGIPCTNSSGSGTGSSTGKKCKPNHKPGPIWIETIVSPPSKCCQNVTIGKIYQSFNNDCSNCCSPNIGSAVFAGPVFSGFGCPCDGEDGDTCYCPSCRYNIDCQKPTDDGYTPTNSPASGGTKTNTELSVCRQYGNEVLGVGVGGFGASMGPQSWTQMTVERICNNNPQSADHSCTVSFVAFFGVSGSGEVDLPGLIGEDENGAPPTYDDGTPVEPCSVGELAGKLQEIVGASDIKVFVNTSSCHMAGDGDNPWELYGNGDVTVGGQSANPYGGVKPADDANSPYGNEDDGVDCG